MLKVITEDNVLLKVTVHVVEASSDEMFTSEGF